MIRLIVALDAERGIAKNGIQPWKLPTDERYFAAQTKRFGGIVVMGRKTYEVIGHALPDRRNIVVTHSTEFAAPDAEVVHDLAPVFRLAETEDLWIIGGQELYEQTLARADELYITHIDAVFGCDRFFPAYEQLFVVRDAGTWQEERGQRFRYCIYEHADLTHTHLSYPQGTEIAT